MGSHTTDICPVSEVRTHNKRSFLALLSSIILALRLTSYVLYAFSVSLCASTTTETRRAHEHPHVQANITIISGPITALHTNKASVLKQADWSTTIEVRLICSRNLCTLSLRHLLFINSRRAHSVEQFDEINQPICSMRGWILGIRISFRCNLLATAGLGGR